MPSRNPSIRDRVLAVVAEGDVAPRDLSSALPDVPANFLRKALRSLHAKGAVRVDSGGHLSLPRPDRRNQVTARHARTPQAPAQAALDAGHDEAADAPRIVPPPSDPATVATLTVMEEGGLWRVRDLVTRTGFGMRATTDALAGLRVRDEANPVVHGQWRSAHVRCDLSTDGRTLTARLLGFLMDGRTHAVADLPSYGCTPITLLAAIKRMRADGLIVGTRRGFVACRPEVRAELVRRLAVASD